MLKSTVDELQGLKGRIADVRDALISAKAKKESLESQIKDMEIQLAELGLDDIDNAEEYLEKEVIKLKESVEVLRDDVTKLEEVINE